MWRSQHVSRINAIMLLQVSNYFALEINRAVGRSDEDSAVELSMMIVTDEKAHHAFFFFLWLYLERLPPTWTLPLAGSCSWGTVCVFARSVSLSKRTRPPVSMCRSVLISPMTWEIFSWSVNNAVLESTQPDQIILTIMPNKWQREKEGLEGDGWPRVTGSSHAASAGKVLVCVLQKFL